MISKCKKCGRIIIAREKLTLCTECRIRPKAVRAPNDKMVRSTGEVKK